LVIPSSLVSDPVDSEPFAGPIEVGSRVGVNLGVRIVPGTIVEDRGEIGVAGRRLVRVAVPVTETDEVRTFEVPVDELVALPAVA
jgi:hypothetical protein